MIQQREVQVLWEAVESLRQRVDELEGGVKEQHEHYQPGYFQYVASATSNRKTFHRRGCKFTRRFTLVAGGFLEFQSYEAALAAGLVPCKSCGAQFL